MTFQAPPISTANDADEKMDVYPLGLPMEPVSFENPSLNLQYSLSVSQVPLVEPEHFPVSANHPGMRLLLLLSNSYLFYQLNPRANRLSEAGKNELYQRALRCQREITAQAMPPQPPPAPIAPAPVVNAAPTAPVQHLMNASSSMFARRRSERLAQKRVRTAADATPHDHSSSADIKRLK